MLLVRAFASFVPVAKFTFAGQKCIGCGFQIEGLSPVIEYWTFAGFFFLLVSPLLLITKGEWHDLVAGSMLVGAFFSADAIYTFAVLGRIWEVTISIGGFSLTLPAYSVGVAAAPAFLGSVLSWVSGGLTPEDSVETT